MTTSRSMTTSRTAIRGDRAGPPVPISGHELTIFVVDASAAAHELLLGDGLPVPRRHVIAHAVGRTAADRLGRLEGGNTRLALVTFDTEVRAVTEPTRHLDAARVLRQIGSTGSYGRTLATGLRMAGLLTTWFIDRFDDDLPVSVCVLALLAGTCSDPDETARVYEELTEDPRVHVACAAVGVPPIRVPFGCSQRVPVATDADGLASAMLTMARGGSLRRRESIALG